MGNYYLITDETIVGEVWEPVFGIGKYYLISDFGRIKRLPRLNCNNQYKEGFFLRQKKTPKGYLEVYLTVDGVVSYWRVSRLVATMFCRNPFKKTQVNHINGIKTDNRAVNLEWVTASENQKHSFTHLGRRPTAYWSGKRGVLHHRSIKIKCNETGVVYSSMSEAAKEYNVSSSAIHKSVVGAIKKLKGKTFSLFNNL